MKQLLAILMVFGVATTALAKTTLRIPIRTESGLTAADLNKQLKAKKLKEIPLYFEISTLDAKRAYERFQEMGGVVDGAIEKLGLEDSWSTDTFPNSDSAGTCYTGDAGAAGDAVVGLVFELAGSLYTEQMNLWGSRYQKEKYINDEYDNATEIEKLLNADSKLWKEWRGTGEAVLLVVAIGDSGDDMNDSLIYKCK